MRILAVGVIGTVVVLGGANTWVRLLSRDGIVPAATVEPRPVALVLGAGVHADGTPTPFLAVRLDVAAELLQHGKVDVLLVSGDNRVHTHDEPTAMRAYLLSIGVPAGRIVTDHAGRDTYDSCARARRIFGVERLVVVSQSYHLPRALAVCRALGVDAVGVGDDTMRAYAPAVWTQGRMREWPAAIKAAWDVTTGRDPVLGPPETGVVDALRRARDAD